MQALVSFTCWNANHGKETFFEKIPTNVGSVSLNLTMLDDLHKISEMRQDGTAHQDGDLLHNLNSSVSSLPRLLALAHGLQEGQQRRDT